jgi:translation elongation factor EF-Tu-like GTPase
MVMPHDCVKIFFELINVVACEQDMQFSIRVRGKTFDVGVIQSIIDCN